MKRMAIYFSAIAIACSASTAIAQNVQRIQIRRGVTTIVGTSSTSGARALNLLRNTKVQKELKLEEDQVVEVTRANEELQKARREAYAKLDRTLPIQQRIQQSRDLSQKFNQQATQQVKAILEPKQLARLDQIQLQMQGVRALLTPPVQKQLKISDTQKTKFAEVQQSTSQARAKMYQDLRANGRIDIKKLQAASKKLNEKMEKEMHAVLTKEQQASFDKLKGPKFELPNRAAAVGGVIRLGVQGGRIQIRRAKPRKGAEKKAKPEKKSE